MKPYIPLLNKTPLFQNIRPNEIEAILSCMHTRVASYSKGTTLIHYGEICTDIGILLSGQIHVTRDDFWGNNTLITHCNPGDIFGETYALSPHGIYEVNIQASMACEVLYLDINKILTICTSSCSYHTQLIHNLLAVISARNYFLSKKIEHITRRTTRGKLLSYLSTQSSLNGSSSFQIPFNRQQLADYLAVDRSAMSAELCHLRDEGILTFHKNEFHLLELTEQDI